MTGMTFCSYRTARRGALLTTWLLSRYSALVLLVGLASASSAQAGEMCGRVIKVPDGDTFILLDDNRRQHRVRLLGIDAPEKRQAFGHRSRENLASLIAQRNVCATYRKHDKYGRLVGRVKIPLGDVGALQLRAGMAWFHRAYASGLHKPDRLLYGREEADAQVAQRGLWAESKPIAPWKFRHRRFVPHTEAR